MANEEYKLKPTAIYHHINLPFGCGLSLGNNARWTLDQGIYVAVARIGKNILQFLLGRWYVSFSWRVDDGE